MYCGEVTMVNVRACKSRDIRYTELEQITQFVYKTQLSYLIVKMADSRSRVVSALNFLTGEGICYHPDGVQHTELEALIEDYFNDGNDEMIDDSSDESDHNNEGLIMPHAPSYIYCMTSDEQTMSEHVVNNTPVNEVDYSNGIIINKYITVNLVHHHVHRRYYGS